MKLLDQLLGQQRQAPESLNLQRGEFSVPDVPNVNDIPVKSASQDNGTDGDTPTVEVKHGIAESEAQLAWYKVVFDTPFQEETRPTITAVSESRPTQESQASYSPPSHESPGITALELIGISIPAPEVGDRSLSGRALADVGLDNVALSDKALSDRALQSRGLDQRQLDQVSVDTQVDLVDVSIPRLSLPSASVPGVSISQPSVPSRSLEKVDFSGNVDVSQIDSIGGDINPTESIESARNNISNQVNLPLESFGQNLGDLGLTEQVTEEIDELQANRTFEEIFKERNRNTGRSLVNVGGDFVNNVVPGLGVNLDGELVDVLRFIATELYGAPGDPSQGEGFVESVWGAIGALIDDAVKAGFIQRGNEIEELRSIAFREVNEYDKQITDAINNLIDGGDNNIVGEIQRLANASNTQMGNISQATDNQLQNIAGQADTKVGNLRGGVNDRLQTLRNQVNGSLTDINGIQDNVEAELQEFNQQINDILAQLSSDLDSIFADLVANIEEQVNLQGDEIESQVNQLADSTQQQVNDLRSNLETNMVSNNDAIRDAINTLNDAVNVELQDMNANVEQTLNDIISEADAEFKGLRSDVLDQMQTTVDDVRQNNDIIETTLQDMNSNTESTIQNMNSDVETTIQQMNQEIESQLQGQSDEIEQQMVTLRDNIEDELNALSDDIEQKLNTYNDNVLTSYNDITALAEQAFNGSITQVNGAIGAPEGEAPSPVQIRNVDHTGFEFLGYQGGMTIHWNAIGTPSEGGSDIVGGGGGREGVPSPEPPEQLPGVIFSS